ncbi:MAG: hypothetical protein H6707_10240 [Deltaproteobacteria bacterium]|nr:hypothetical protein [Deltaproteobacteria bacterium]
MQTLNPIVAVSLWIALGPANVAFSADHRVAAADARGATVNVDPRLPFDSAALIQALGLRLPNWRQAGGTLEIGRDRTGLFVRYNGRTERFTVDTDGAALRHAALIAANLLERPTEVDLPPPITVSSKGTEPARQQIVGAALPLIGTGSNAERPMIGLAADLSVRVRAYPLGAFLNLEYGSYPAIGDQQLGAPFFAARLGAFWQPIAALQLRGHVIVQPTLLSGEVDTRQVSRSDTHWGLGLGVAWRQAIWRRIEFLGLAGSDFFFSRTAYQAAGKAIVASQRVALWLGAGLGYRWTR